MPATINAHIVVDEKGVAWIDDSNVKVIEVALDMIADRMSPDQIHHQHPHLSLAQVHAALAHYYDRQAEFDAQIARDRDEIAALRSRAGDSPALRKLRAAGHLP